MKARPFPYASLATVAISAVVLTVSTTIYERHCAFGFGGFQCNDPVAGYGDILLTTTLASLAVLTLATMMTAWKLVNWFRFR